MSQTVSQPDQPAEIERPDEPWKYPYVAGAVDLGASLKAGIMKTSDTPVGYQITVEIVISNPQELPLAFIDEFCSNHDLYPRFRETETSKRLVISRRENVREFIQLIRPYLIGQAEAADILVEDLLPGLNSEKKKSKGGFIELVRYVDQIREVGRYSGKSKYSEGYFRDEWDMPKGDYQDEWFQPE